MQTVYHHTSVAHLPWIVRDGSLVRSPAWPDPVPMPAVVWATTDPAGDRTVAACSQRTPALIPRARIAFPQDLFLPWVTEALKLKSEAVAAACDTAYRMVQPNVTGWFMSYEDVPMSEAFHIDVRTYRTPWRTVEVDTVTTVSPPEWRPWWEGSLSIPSGTWSAPTGWNTSGTQHKWRPLNEDS